MLIRFIEIDNGKLIYKSGGGITFLSDVEKEYDEMLKKVYVPVIWNHKMWQRETS